MITFESLKELEIKINKSCRNSKNYMGWMESQTRTNYECKWQKMMLKLRGWDVVCYNNTNTSWVDYCDKNGLSIDYGFNDILA